MIPAGGNGKSETHPVKKKGGRKILEVKKNKRLFDGKVLVAEDHEGCQVIIRKLLQRLGLKVILADDGDEAVEKAVNDKFDLIFMDVRMPRLNGIEATAALHEKGITTPIVALTAHAMQGDRQLCIDSGFDDYLSKPIERQKLLEVLDKYCRCGSVGIREV